MTVSTSGYPDYIAGPLRELNQRNVGRTFVEGHANDPFEFFANKTPDARLRPTKLVGAPLQRGRMVRRNDSGSGDPVALLNFVYNPNTVNFSYNIDPEALVESEKEFGGVPMLGPSLSCSFELIFDRTYEVLTYNDSLGVLEDVIALEHLMGIFTDAETGIISAPQSQTVSVYFGGVKSMAFKGFMTGAGVTMTHWTPDMIPTRLSMNVSIRRVKEADRASDRDTALSDDDQRLIQNWENQTGNSWPGSDSPPASSTPAGSGGGGSPWNSNPPAQYL